jgi:hypothetical protein
MGSGGADLMMSNAALKLVPFDVECKNTKSFPSLAALKQARDRGSSYTVCTIWKPPRKSMEESIIYFDLREFLEFLKEMYGKEEDKR